MMIVSSDDSSLYLKLGIVAGLVVYGGIVFWYVVKKIMPKILSRSRKRDRSRKSG
jgi:hypothetical protein